MADEQVSAYGYAEDEQKISPFDFGLNAGKCFLKKFEWTPTGGKDGAEQEALDIEFEINGETKKYRLFPVTQGFDKNNQPVTDPSSKEFKEALTDFNAIVTHILHAIVGDGEAVKAALSRPFKSFKDFCTTAKSVLPKNTPNIALDIFMQYQWALRDGQKKTYLEIPRKMKYGRWLTKAVLPQGGPWTEKRIDNPTDKDRKALWYVDGAGNEHPFVKGGWFMSSKFAIQQREDDDDTNNSGTPSDSTPPPAGATTGTAQASGW